MQIVVFKENLGFLKCVNIGPKQGVQGARPEVWAAFAPAP